MKSRITAIILSALLATSLSACGGSASQAETETTIARATNAPESGNTAIDSTVFTERDLKQEADTDGAKSITLSDGKTETITEEGTYVVSGSASNAQIVVDAADDAKVQLVLSGVTVTNDSTPVIYVKNADKTFVTTEIDSQNNLTVSGSFTADGETNTDAVIFSKDDLVLNGSGTLAISSTDNGVTSKDDIKITGGTLQIDCVSDAIEANDTISVANGTINIKTGKDGLHAENSDDNTQGSIYISGGTFQINAASDGMQATTTAVIDGGTFNITASEGIEATNVTINGGDITINAGDDGINASRKSSENVCITIGGGNIKITMGQGDTDGIDSNGDLYITGGTIDITGQSACDYDGTAQKTGGTLIVNGTETDTIPNQMMGGGRGGMGGPGGMGGDPMQGGGMTPPGGIGGF